MRFLLLISIMFCTVSLSVAQKPSLARVVYGKVIADDRQPVPKAMVSLLKRSDSTLFKVELTDSLGVYSFYNIPAGKYWINVSAAQYEVLASRQLVIDSANREAAIDFTVKPRVKSLDEVVVKYEKPVVEQKVDMMVFHVANTVLAKTGTALDVLRRSPTVIVDHQDNISMVGLYATVYIDGRETYLSGRDLAALLKSIPGDDIEAIEIINNPSSKYDASGTGGIINIRTKKLSRRGISGNVGGEWQQNRYAAYTGRFNLNVNTKTVSFFLNSSLARPTFYGDTYDSRVFSSGADTSFSSAVNGGFKSSSTNTFLNTGLDYYINKHNIIGVLVNGFFVDGNTRSSSLNNIRIGPGMPSLLTTRVFGISDYTYWLYNLNYSTKLDGKSKDLKIKMDYSKSKQETEQEQHNGYFDWQGHETRDRSISRYANPADVEIRGIRADYSQPVGKSFQLDAGLKFSHATITNDSRFDSLDGGTVWIKDIVRSNLFNYDETISAGYASLLVRGKKLDARFGLRAEHTTTDGESAPFNGSFTNDYTSLFPSVALLHKISANHRLLYSYGRRIERPTYRYLNPFRVYSDAYTYETGNPFLRPQYTNTLRINYTLKQKYTAGLSYSFTDGIIAQTIRIDTAKKEVVYTNENLNSVDRIDANVFVPLAIKKWFQSSNNITAGYHSLKDHIAGRISQFFFSVNNSNSFILSKSLRSEVSLRYQSPRLAGIYRYRSQFSLSMGISKTLFNNALSVTLNANDIFYTNYPVYTLTRETETAYSRGRYGSRSFQLGISYQFRKGKNQRDRFRESATNDEQNRAR